MGYYYDVVLIHFFLSLGFESKRGITLGRGLSPGVKTIKVVRAIV